jgi:hypothetical protein
VEFPGALKCLRRSVQELKPPATVVMYIDKAGAYISSFCVYHAFCFNRRFFIMEIFGLQEFKYFSAFD